MKLIITSILLLGLIAPAEAKVSRAAEILLTRAESLTGKSDGLYCFIPKGADVPKMAKFVMDSIGQAKATHEPLIIHPEDPAVGTRIITTAFALVRPGALRGCTIICAVGKKNDSYLRPVIEATGAKLYVEPVP